MSLLQIICRNYASSFTRLQFLTRQTRLLSTLSDSCQGHGENECQHSSQLLKVQTNLNVVKRFKKKASKVQKILEEIKEMEESSDEDTDDEDKSDGSKRYVYKVGSMRIDVVAKAGVGISRHAVEKGFYNGKIYLNGQKVLKKGVDVKLHDVIDFVKEFDPNDDNKVLVRRIKIVDWKLENLGYKITVTKEIVSTSDYLEKN